MAQPVEFRPDAKENIIIEEAEKSQSWFKVFGQLNKTPIQDYVANVPALKDKTTSKFLVFEKADKGLRAIVNAIIAADKARSAVFSDEDSLSDQEDQMPGEMNEEEESSVEQEQDTTPGMMQKISEFFSPKKTQAVLAEESEDADRKLLASAIEFFSPASESDTDAAVVEENQADMSPEQREELALNKAADTANEKMLLSALKGNFKEFNKSFKAFVDLYPKQYAYSSSDAEAVYEKLRGRNGPVLSSLDQGMLSYGKICEPNDFDANSYFVPSMEIVQEELANLNTVFISLEDARMQSYPHQRAEAKQVKQEAYDQYLQSAAAKPLHQDAYDAANEEGKYFLSQAWHVSYSNNFFDAIWYTCAEEYREKIINNAYRSSRAAKPSYYGEKKEVASYRAFQDELFRLADTKLNTDNLSGDDTRMANIEANRAYENKLAELSRGKQKLSNDEATKVLEKQQPKLNLFIKQAIDICKTDTQKLREGVKELKKQHNAGVLENILKNTGDEEKLTGFARFRMRSPKIAKHAWNKFCSFFMMLEKDAYTDELNNKVFELENAEEDLITINAAKSIFGNTIYTPKLKDVLEEKFAEDSSSMVDAIQTKEIEFTFIEELIFKIRSFNFFATNNEEGIHEYDNQMNLADFRKKEDASPSRLEAAWLYVKGLFSSVRNKATGCFGAKEELVVEDDSDSESDDVLRKNSMFRRRHSSTLRFHQSQKEQEEFSDVDLDNNSQKISSNRGKFWSSESNSYNPNTASSKLVWLNQEEGHNSVSGFDDGIGSRNTIWARGRILNTANHDYMEGISPVSQQKVGEKDVVNNWEPTSSNSLSLPYSFDQQDNSDSDESSDQEFGAFDRGNNSSSRSLRSVTLSPESRPRSQDQDSLSYRDRAGGITGGSSRLFPAANITRSSQDSTLRKTIKPSHNEGSRSSTGYGFGNNI